MRGWWVTSALVLLVVLPLGLFGGSLGHDFVDLDDKLNTERFAGWRGSTGEKYVQIWTTPHARQFAPVTGTVMELLREVAASSPPRRPSAIPGLDPRPFHAASLALHVVNGLLVAGILLRLTGHLLGSLLGALLFALHPAQVEAFAWVGDTNTVLGGFFFLSALLLYLVYDHRRSAATTGPGAPASAIVWYAAATVAFVLAVLAKPTTVVLPLAVLLVGRFCLERRPAILCRDMAPWAALALPIVTATAYLQRAETLSFAVGGGARVLVALDAIAFYLRSLVDMGPRAFDYGRSPATVLGAPGASLECAAVAAALVVAFLWMHRRAPAGVACLGLFLVGLLPVLGLKPFVYQTVSTVADRYLYLPLLGVSLAVATVVRARSRLAVPVVLGALLACGHLARTQLDVWRDSERLFTNTTQVNPRSWLAYNDLAAYYERNGRRPEAIDNYLQSAALKFRVATLQRAARLLLEERRPARAAMLLRRVLETDPQNASASHDLAYALSLMGGGPEAEALAKPGTP